MNELVLDIALQWTEGDNTIILEKIDKNTIPGK